MKVLVPVGTRPEIIKLAPVVRALRDHALEARVVATGQHYDASLTDAFYDALGMHPDARWELSGDEASRVSAILEHALREIDATRPDVVLVLGDTYTVPLLCLAARRHRVPVVHVEAGLRSFNETSVEEVNRRVAAATASLHLAPTDQAARFLHAEGVPAERVRVVGNPITDVLRETGVTARPPQDRRGVLLTAHRPTNVDDPVRLERLVRLIERLADELGPVTFPVHPRTRARLDDADAYGRLQAAGVDLREPVPYEEMLDLLTHCRVVVTDSGGLQEEAAWVGVPVVVMRTSTPRWEGVAAGTSVLTGLDVDLALETAHRLASAQAQQVAFSTPCPYGDGHASTRIAEVLADPATQPLLTFGEPDFVSKEPPA